ncbi:MAG: thioredoxin family protein [Bacteroidetes bacterium]|nr:thioredoxin family protein [Bacteroidota bacterium]
MKKLSFIALVLFSFMLQAQQSPTLHFSTVKEKAKTENKKILLYFSGSDWCAPCIKFRMNFINSEQFKTYSADKIVVYDADFPRQKKNALSKELTAENEALADQYNKKGLFPYILLLNSDGKIIKEWNGYPKETIEEFIKALD